MIRLFVDTNVVIDTFSHDRTEDWPYSEAITNLSAFSDSVKICISIKSVADISYVGGKIVGRTVVKTTLKKMLNDCKIISLEDISLYEALNSPCPDFEDALQIYCAETACCDYIITRNKKHFSGYTDIPVYSPKEFMQKLKAVQTVN